MGKQKKNRNGKAKLAPVKSALEIARTRNLAVVTPPPPAGTFTDPESVKAAADAVMEELMAVLKKHQMGLAIIGIVHPLVQWTEYKDEDGTMKKGWTLAQVMRSTRSTLFLQPDVSAMNVLMESIARRLFPIGEPQGPTIPELVKPVQVATPKT